ncbi:MAG: DUF177 domain-containing protein [bacterium]|nr:DUF177 domain-containing protein [bacterium]
MMRSSNPFVIGVNGLLGRTGVTRSVTVIGPMEVDLARVEGCGPVTADLIIEAKVGGLLVRGEARADLILKCNRCLRPVDFRSASPVSQVYGDRPDDQIGGIDDEGNIDLSLVIHDELCLSVPLVTLCSEFCRGICPMCGVDLNEGTCPGHAETTESPFAALEAWLGASLDLAESTEIGSSSS